LMDAALATDDPRLQGYRPSQIPLDRALLMTTTEQQELIMCASVKPDTDSGRIELFCQDFEDQFGYGVPRYQAVTRSKPFSIITPSSSKRTNATFGGDSASAGPEIVEINPADALAAGIDEDDLVEIANQRGRVVLQARLTDAVAIGVLYSPKGTWLASSASGQTVNALIDAELKTDIVDGACYNETFVDIRRLAQ
jgi:anaerobic selenocysteine-containing dehydrogenase